MIEVYRELLRLKNEGESGVSITVVEKEGHGPAVPGAKMVVCRGNKHVGTVGGGALEFAAIKQAEHVLETGQSLMKKYILSPANEVLDAEGETTGMMCGGRITMFFEYIGSGPYLYLFGAGHVGKALIYHLKPLDYHVTLLDSREGMAEKVEGVHCHMTVDYPSALEGHDVKKDSFFLVASHSHEFDYVILERIYKSNWNPKYIGVMASRRKRDTMLKRLKEDIGPDVDLSVLYQPVGLNIGGPAPHEIAVSIIAEMQAVRYGKTGHKHMNIK